MDVHGATAFLQEHRTGARPAVLVVATDVLTDSVAVRDFLSAGNKIVWPATLPPGVWPADSQGRRGGYAAIQWNAPRGFVGVDYRGTSFDAHSTRPSALGRAFGLTPSRTAWTIAPTEATRVLALDDMGRAAAWIREYGPHHSGGFIVAPENNKNNMLALFLLAEWWPQ